MICPKWIGKCEVTGLTDCFGVIEECPSTIEIKEMYDKMNLMLSEVTQV